MGEAERQVIPVALGLRLCRDTCNMLKHKSRNAVAYPFSGQDCKQLLPSDFNSIDCNYDRLSIPTQVFNLFKDVILNIDTSLPHFSRGHLQIRERKTES